ncbi:NAD(P)H-dependent oxidoreductase [Acetobacteraceae bacterium H6797]|nr:NAD(P)H-dependent oxidoreductase [Acetobacteraceae bacterium H6797]
MHILIVTAHPDPTSYTQAAVAQFVSGLETARGTTYEVLNLSAADFDPRFGSIDHDVFNGRREHGEDILAEQRRVDRADALVLLFPVYWWSMPAVMKGWIDRVFTAGWAFIDDPDKGVTRLLGRLKGRVIAIGGVDRGTYERRGYLDALQAQIVQGIFGFCGMPALGLDLLLPLDVASAEEGLRRAFELGRLTAQGS